MFLLEFEQFDDEGALLTLFGAQGLVFAFDAKFFSRMCLVCPKESLFSVEFLTYHEKQYIKTLLPLTQVIFSEEKAILWKMVLIFCQHTQHHTEHPELFFEMFKKFYHVAMSADCSIFQMYFEGVVLMIHGCSFAGLGEFIDIYHEISQLFADPYQFLESTLKKEMTSNEFEKSIEYLLKICYSSGIPVYSLESLFLYWRMGL